MRHLVILLPALLALQVGVQPAFAWTWPVDGPVLRTFNVDANPYAGGQHRGIDVGAPVGTPVLAPAAGKVSFAGSVGTNGPTVTIQTPDGLSVTLVQLGTIGVSKGADVDEGAPIGSVGASSEVEIAEPHVHLGIRRTSDPNGYLDPLAFLPARPGAQAPPETEPVPAPAPAPAVKQPVRPSSPPVEAPRAAPAHARPSSKTVEVRRLARSSRSKDRVRAAGPGNQLGRGVIRAAPRERHSFEPAPVRAFAKVPARSPDRRNPLLFAVIVVAAALAAGLAVLRRQLPDAHAADGAAPVFLEGLAAATENAQGLRLGEEDRLVLDGDLEGVLLSEAEALADLDGDHDPAELVYVADDPRPRHSSRSLSRCLDRLPRGHRFQAPARSVRGSRLSVPARCPF
jgi:hypothetical protein